VLGGLKIPMVILGHDVNALQFQIWLGRVNFRIQKSQFSMRMLSAFAICHFFVLTREPEISLEGHQDVLKYMNRLVCDIRLSN
jgi:hypothetical protein